MMLDPILNAPFAIQVHVVCALAAILIGPLAMYRKRRDAVHRSAGYVWVVAIAALSVSGLFIKSDFGVLGRFGPIHLLCFFALHGVIDGVRHAAHGNIVKHQQAMRSVWYGGIGFAGLFTLMPGRTMNKVIFGENAEMAYPVIVVGCLALIAHLVLGRIRQRGTKMSTPLATS